MIKRGSDSPITIRRTGQFWLKRTRTTTSPSPVSSGTPPTENDPCENLLETFNLQPQLMGGNTYNQVYYSCEFQDDEALEVWKGSDLVHKRTIITFDSNGGSSVPSQTRTWGVENILEPTPPTRANYEFKGWYTAASGGSKITFPLIAGNSDVTYHAQWELLVLEKTANPSISFTNIGVNNFRVTISNGSGDFGARIFADTFTPPTTSRGYASPSVSFTGVPARTYVYAYAHATGKDPSDIVSARSPIS